MTNMDEHASPDEMRDKWGDAHPHNLASVNRSVAMEAIDAYDAALDRIQELEATLESLKEFQMDIAKAADNIAEDRDQALEALQELDRRLDATGHGKPIEPDTADELTKFVRETIHSLDTEQETKMSTEEPQGTDLLPKAYKEMYAALAVNEMGRPTHPCSCEDCNCPLHSYKPNQPCIWCENEDHAETRPEQEDEDGR